MHAHKHANTRLKHINSEIYSEIKFDGEVGCDNTEIISLEHESDNENEDIKFDSITKY